MAQVRPARAQQPFVFQAGDHVGDAAVAVSGQARGVEGLIARRQDSGAHLDGPGLPFILEIDGPLNAANPG